MSWKIHCRLFHDWKISQPRYHYWRRHRSPIITIISSTLLVWAYLQTTKYEDPDLWVWYGHTFGLHCWPAGHSGGCVRVSPSSWCQVGASLLQGQLPARQVRPCRLCPSGLSAIRLTSSVPHAVASVRVFGGHGRYCVSQTADLFVHIGTGPLTDRVTAHCHGERDAGGNSGKSNREHLQASMWAGPVWTYGVTAKTRREIRIYTAVLYMVYTHNWSYWYWNTDETISFLEALSISIKHRHKTTGDSVLYVRTFSGIGLSYCSLSSLMKIESATNCHRQRISKLFGTSGSDCILVKNTETMQSDSP